MLKTNLLHPEILGGLAAAGHLTKILISDGNYPSANKPNPRAKVVWANFTAGVVDACTILRLVCEIVPIEAVELMAPAKTGPYAMKNDPPIWKKYGEILRKHSDFRGECVRLAKPQFNEQAQSEDLGLVIATAETQIYANILMTIGVVR
ncbi:MAG TPA: RbsD/FucU domain-containing protein [Tepidisphaeraceae bacterium]|jgi:L-fucose mutarotase|nr:RbsD/FucU domain-containing protein [Tepidisphaeraceae bacterium]